MEKKPIITLVIFTILQDSLQVFFSDTLPGKELDDKTLEEHVEELTKIAIGDGVGEDYSEQLYTIQKDHTLNVVYYVLLDPERAAKIDQHMWHPVILGSEAESDSAKATPESDSGQARMTKDVNQEIIAYALQRLRWKIEYTNVVYSLLPHEFTLSELQKTYEAILGKSLDKRNFRKKILSLGFVHTTGKKRFGTSRPAELFTFKNRTPEIVKIFS